MKRAIVMFLALVATGCDFGTLDDLSQDEASAGSTEVAKQAFDLWRAYDAADADIARAAATLAGVVERAGARPVQATIDSMTKEILGIPANTRDPANTQGMLVVTEIPCSLAQIEAYASARNQDEIYPNSYETYERTYRSSIRDFLGGAAPTVSWNTRYTVTLLGRKYEAKLTGGVRRVAGAAPSGGALLVSRTVLDEPAKFLVGDDAEFNQDYQIEAFYEVAPSKVLHFYAIWREFRIGTLTSSAGLYINLLLGNSVDFDIRTGLVCKQNSPLPKTE